MILRMTEIALWSIGLTCVVGYGAVTVQAKHAQAAAISSLESILDIEAVNDPDRSQWSGKRIAEHRDAISTNDKSVPVALLDIPAVQIHVAVFEGTSAQVLNLGAGRVPGTAQVGGHGNLALAGHRDGYFRGLKDINLNDRISIRHVSGVENYSVTELSIVDPQDISVLAPTDESTITLITCYPFYFVGSAPQRFIVRAERIVDEDNFLN